MDDAPESQPSWLIMIPLGLPIFMVNIDMTVVNLALPQMARDLHVSLGTIQWVISGYMIASAAVVVFGGRLADMLGRRRVYIATVLLFITSSAAAGLAQRPYQIILSRIVQGMGMAAYPISMAILYHTFPGKRRNLALGISTSIAGSSAALGPTLGGVVLHALNWRWVFLINIPLGIVAVVTALMWVRESEAEGEHKIDYLGQALLALGLLSVLMALNEGRRWGYGSPWFVLVLVGGATALGLFIAVERRAKSPLLDLDLFRSRGFTAAILVRVLFQYACMSTVFLVSLYAQNILSHTPLAAGLMLLWLTATASVCAPFHGKWIGRAGPRRPVSTGLLLVAVSCGLFSMVSSTTPLWMLAPPLMLFGLGAAAVFPGCASGALSSVPERKAAAASGFLNMNAALGGAIGITVTGLVLHARATTLMARRLAAQAVALSPAQLDAVDNAATGAHSAQRLAAELPSQIASPVVTDVREAFASGFALNMRVSLALILLALALAWTLLPAAKGTDDRPA